MAEWDRYNEDWARRLYRAYLISCTRAGNIPRVLEQMAREKGYVCRAKDFEEALVNAIYRKKYNKIWRSYKKALKRTDLPCREALEKVLPALLNLIGERKADALQPTLFEM